MSLTPVAHILGGMLVQKGSAGPAIVEWAASEGSETMKWTSEEAPRFKARMAGSFYLLNIVTSLVAFSGNGPHWLAIASGYTATAAYIAVTALLYDLFKPVNRSISLVAAVFSLLGCATGVLTPLHLMPFDIHSLVFFGCYCVLVGYLILRSTFLPRILGVLMAIAGLGWLTFLSPQLANHLSPYHYISGGIGEGLLTLWLLAMGVNPRRWNEQAGSSAPVWRTAAIRP